MSCALLNVPRRQWTTWMLGALLAGGAVTLGGCAKKSGTDLTGPPPDPNRGIFETLGFGTAENLEFITWNVRTFPNSTPTTPREQAVRYLVEAIRAIDADVVCLQEINDRSAFSAVDDSLDEYEGILGSDDAFNLAILYKRATVSGVNSVELFPSLWQPFPRAPLEMGFTFAGKSYRIINNHYKCCGDGRIDSGDPRDEESRRAEASRLLEEHIRTVHPSERVIVVGDLNDRLTDAPADNVFQVFFDRPGEYRFADLAIAEGPSSDYSWIGSNPPSHLDHILVSDELFSAVSGGGALVVTLKPEVDLDGGINEFRSILSDHRPVALRIAP